jgi:hypothetical protein
MQWSGIAAAGMAKIVMLSTMAANFPMHVIPAPLFSSATSSICAKLWS